MIEEYVITVLGPNIACVLFIVSTVVLIAILTIAFIKLCVRIFQG
jgi:hypothetical protein